MGLMIKPFFPVGVTGCDGCDGCVQCPGVGTYVFPSALLLRGWVYNNINGNRNM